MGSSTMMTPDFWPAFVVLDADQDGRIGYDDLRAFYGVGADEDTIGVMMLAADTNKDGYVEYEEFKHVLRGSGLKSGEVHHGVMGEVFRMMDRDGDGLLSSDDLQGYMASAGLRVSDVEVRDMMRLAGGDGVTFEGLLQILGFSKHA